MIRVYLSASYIGPDAYLEVHRALEHSQRLIGLGVVPVIPHRAHFLEKVITSDFAVWTAMDLQSLLSSDAILLLPGISGVQYREFAAATDARKFVAHSMDQLICWVRRQQRVMA